MNHSHNHISHKKPLWWVLILTVSYMAAEVMGGWITGSLTLLADAGHMAIDVVAVSLGIFALWIAQLPPTNDKTFGYYRAEILVALVNGALLFAVSLWIIVEAFDRFWNPPTINGLVMTWIAIGGLIVNGIGLFLMSPEKHDNLNARAVWLHLLSDALGSVSAILAGILVWKFDWYLADPIISIFIALLILYGACRLLLECVNVLLESVPKGMSLSEIRKCIESVKSVVEVHDLHVWTVTSGVPALSAHVRVEQNIDHSRVLEDITSLLKEQHRIEHITLQVEPTNFSHQKWHV